MNVVKKAFLLTYFLCHSNLLYGQQGLSYDYSTAMQIPSIKTLTASETHLYVLSDDIGMPVFRLYADSLQWLYTSSGMQTRGDVISADIRFAYLYGDSRRLTVLEPTSVLGVYSSTYLDRKPLAAARLNNQLYLALNDLGLGTLSLESPESIDSEVNLLELRQLNDLSVLDLKTSLLSNQLFVLTNDHAIHLYQSTGKDLQHTVSFSLAVPIVRIFLDQELLWGTTATGDVYVITANGLGRLIGNIKEPVQKVFKWNGFTFIRSESGKVWTAKANSPIALWKGDPKAGNFITKSLDQLWIAENDRISKIRLATTARVSNESSTGFSIKPISDRILTYPNPLLMAFELEQASTPSDVKFSYRGTAQNVKIQKQGLFWQPTPNQLGLNWFTIIASDPNGNIDSTRFSVDVRSFNAPPRFSPVRKAAIGINEKFELQFNAIDPENPSSKVIRYLGVDLPRNATINESTGLFSWTPAESQVGEHTFRIIASDQLGAASSIDVSLRVLDLVRGDGQ